MTLIEAALPKIENKTLTQARDIVLVLGFAFLTALSSKLKIEIGFVPITAQTLIVILSGALLGSKKGALSQIVFLFGGLVGFPWFSRGGGIGYILSPTFGYIIGFVFAAYLVGWLCERGWDRNLKTAILAMFFGNIILYIPGLIWLARFACPEANLFCFGVGFEKVLAVGFYPFIFGDLLKIILAGVILPFGWKIIQNHCPEN